MGRETKTLPKAETRVRRRKEVPVKESEVLEGRRLPAFYRRVNKRFP
jgi:hypothetical protein